MKLNVKRLSKTAKIPVKAHKTDAGFDVFADEDITLLKGVMYGIKTGVSISIPNGFYGRLKARSGLTYKTPLNVKEGTIDSGYLGEIKVLANLKETGVDIYKIQKGDKIAQLIIQELPEFEIVEVDELGDSERGEHGFGSTGFRQVDNDVLVYSKPPELGVCQQCKAVKRFLSSKGIGFTEILDGADKLKELGFSSYPIVYIKSKDEYIKGFDVKALNGYARSVE
ncbi:dUTP pyrophosphatase [Enterococcus sp. AZ150]|uniref:dUTP diphosphatase n=1 Tax=Enterococcus sp. AZ150 TaxID=2774866 RepID=UPI003F214E9C